MRANHMEDDDGAQCSTPYGSAPTSPCRNDSLFYYSCPSSPMHFLSTSPVMSPSHDACDVNDFEFSSGGMSAGSGGALSSTMTSADELFLNGKIRPLKAVDLEGESRQESEHVRDGRTWGKLRSRRTRSMSPLRTPTFGFLDDENGEGGETKNAAGSCEDKGANESAEGTTSRSSSAGRNSKRWVFLKDFLYRSKSEGRSNHKFWSNMTFSPGKEKKPDGKKKTANGGKTKGANKSPHELHYKASKAQAEEMKKKTFLPYRQGVIGCLGFSSKGFTAMNGLARALHQVSSKS